MPAENWPFVGSEAIAGGLIKKHHLRANYRAVFPDVYVPRHHTPDLLERARAAWLYSHREGVLAGLTASAMHGAKWVGENLPIELVWTNARCPAGLQTYNPRLRPEEYTVLHGMRVTTVERTGFDVARRNGLGESVARLDALGNATGLTAEAVLAVARQHRGARRLRQLEAVLALYDAGSASPKETWLRLLLMRKGYPRPQTQIAVVSFDCRRRYYLDMGWPDLKIAVEYDGEHHRTDSAQYAKDVLRLQDLHELEWQTIRVVKDSKISDVLARLERAWVAARLRSDREIS